MASAVDICNLSLSHLGESADISSIEPPEGSVYAELFTHFYPLARDVAVQAFAWPFAIKRQYLALRWEPTDESNPYYGRYVYALPADCLEPVALLRRGMGDNAAGNFDIEASDGGHQIVICETEQPILKYTRIVEDTTKFSPIFVDTLAWLLASYMAGPVIKGDAGSAKAKECLAAYQQQLINAQVLVMRGRKVDTGYMDHSPEWMQARGGRHAY